MAKDAGLDLYSLRFEDASVARKEWYELGMQRRPRALFSPTALALTHPLPHVRLQAGREPRAARGEGQARAQVAPDGQGEAGFHPQVEAGED